MPQTISYLSEQQINNTALQRQMDLGMMDASNFSTLSSGDQQVVLNTLFNQYAANVDVYQALSAAEFMLFGFTSLFFQLYPTPPAPLSSGAVDIYNQLQTIVSGYNFPMSSGTWQIPYLQNQIQAVVTNRDQYFQAKADMTGSSQ